MDIPVRLFVKTQFNGTGNESILLSIGLVAENDDECYVELPATGLHLVDAAPSLLSRVISQFGRVPGASVPDRIEMSDRVIDFLRTFEGSLDVYYNRKADLMHLQTLVGPNRSVAQRIRAYDIDRDISTPASKLAWFNKLQACASRRIGGDHALAEAVALKAAWFAEPRAASES